MLNEQIDLLKLHEKINAITPIIGLSIEEGNIVCNYVSTPSNATKALIKAAIDKFINADSSDERQNITSLQELSKTDWIVLRHLEQLQANMPTTLSSDEFLKLLKQRENIRAKITNTIN